MENKTVLTHPSGKKFGEGVMRDNHAHGYWMFWYENGMLMQEGAYENGSVRGQWLYYWSNGNKQHEGFYGEKGKEGPWQDYHDNGQLSGKGEYFDGREQGLWHYWNTDGILSSEGHYLNGRRHGKWRFQIDTQYKFETDWYYGELTNRPFMPPEQPENDKGRYYPVVPGQIEGFIKPFDIDGFASDVFFGCLQSGRRFTYLFNPVSPFTFYDPAQLTLAINVRYEWLWILEKRFTAVPEKFYDNNSLSPLEQMSDLNKDLNSPQKNDHLHSMINVGFKSIGLDRFIVIKDPSVKDSYEKFPFAKETNLIMAVKQAINLANLSKTRVVVAELIHIWPLDI